MAKETHLRDLVRALKWSYGGVWSMPSPATELVLAEGSFEANPLKRFESGYWNVESLFAAAYKSCSFAPGSGYVGKVLTEGQPLWLTGTENLTHCSNTPAQAQFFKVAGIRTLLCIPWFNSVVELGSSTLEPQNQNLLLQISAFLSHMPCVAKQTVNACSPVEGPLISQGLSAGSDEASSDGGVNQVESCASFRHRSLQSTPAPPAKARDLNINHWNHREGSEISVGHDLNECVAMASDESNWRQEFGSTQQQRGTSQSYKQMNQQEAVDFGTSFLCSPPQQMPLLVQLQYNEARSSSQSSSASDPNRDNLPSSTVSTDNHSVCNDSGGPAFKPWNAAAAAAAEQSSLHKSRQSNQAVLRRSLTMNDQIAQLNATMGETNAMAAMRRHAAAEAAPIVDASDALSGHDDAAVSHMLAERKRRQKQKENFEALRALIPFVTKTDRASILGDAINHVKQLTARVATLEAENRELQSQLSQPVRKRSRSSVTEL